MYIASYLVETNAAQRCLLCPRIDIQRQRLDPLHSLSTKGHISQESCAQTPGAHTRSAGGNRQRASRGPQTCAASPRRLSRKSSTLAFQPWELELTTLNDVYMLGPITDSPEVFANNLVISQLRAFQVNKGVGVETVTYLGDDLWKLQQL